jgi:transposase
MATEAITVIGGVDTHKHTHYAAVIDDRGRLLAHRQFPAADQGYRALLEWMRQHGPIAAIGVESTGSFGAALARALTAAGEQVIEVNRPNRIARHMDGKSDRLDAEQIARAVLGRTSTATPKAKSGTVEVIRTLRVTRSSAVKARTQTFNPLAAARRTGRPDQAHPGQPVPAAASGDRRPARPRWRLRTAAAGRNEDRSAGPGPPLEEP